MSSWAEVPLETRLSRPTRLGGNWVVGTQARTKEETDKCGATGWQGVGPNQYSRWQTPKRFPPIVLCLPRTVSYLVPSFSRTFFFRNNLKN